MKRAICLILALGLFAVACSRSPEKSVARGKQYFAQKKYSEAAIEFRNALKKNPNFAEPYYQLGMIYLATGKMGDAGQAVLQAASLDSNNLEIQLNAGNFLLMRSRFEEARRKAESVLKREPGNIRARILLGNSWVGKIDLNQSIGPIKIGFEAEPRLLPGFLTLSMPAEAKPDPQKAAAGGTDTGTCVAAGPADGCAAGDRKRRVNSPTSGSDGAGAASLGGAAGGPDTGTCVAAGPADGCAAGERNRRVNSPASGSDGAGAASLGGAAAGPDTGTCVAAGARDGCAAADRKRRVNSPTSGSDAAGGPDIGTCVAAGPADGCAAGDRNRRVNSPPSSSTGVGAGVAEPNSCLNAAVPRWAGPGVASRTVSARRRATSG